MSKGPMPCSCSTVSPFTSAVLMKTGSAFAVAFLAAGASAARAANESAAQAAPATNRFFMVWSPLWAAPLPPRREGSSPAASPEVLLLSDRVRLAQPGDEFRVDLLGPRDAEDVHVVARRDGVDAAEARVLEPPRQHDVPVEPALPRRHLRERH